MEKVEDGDDFGGPADFGGDDFGGEKRRFRRLSRKRFTHGTTPEEPNQDSGFR